MADAILAAAGAAAAALTANPPRPLKRGARQAAETGRELTAGAGDKLASAAEAFGSALTGAAGHLLSRDEGEQPKKKKNSKRRREGKVRSEGMPLSRH